MCYRLLWSFSLLLMSAHGTSLNYDEEWVYPSKADQYAVTSLVVGTIATLQWKSVMSESTQVSLWLSHRSDANLCPHAPNTECKKIADFIMPPPNGKTGVESLKHKYQWTVSKLGMSYTDIFYLRAFYNTTNPVSITDDTYIQSGYMSLKDTGDPTTRNTTQLPPDPTEVAPTSAVTETTTTRASNSGKVELAIGAGIGIPLCLLAIAAIVGIILHHRRRARRLTAGPAGPDTTLSVSSSRIVTRDDDKAIMLENQLPRGFLDGHPIAHSNNARYELG